MCRCSDVLLNCVRIYTRRSSELRQLLIGISTNRYLPPSGTAGLARSLVRGNSRVPAPPPMIMASVFSVGIFRFIAAFGWYDARQIEFKFVPIAFFALRLRCSTECFLTTRGGVGT